MLWDVSATNSEIANTLISKFAYKMLQWSCKPAILQKSGFAISPVYMKHHPNCSLKNIIVFSALANRENSFLSGKHAHSVWLNQ